MTLKEEWEEFAHQVIPKNASEILMVILERTFYSGMAVMASVSARSMTDKRLELETFVDLEIERERERELQKSMDQS